MSGWAVRISSSSAALSAHFPFTLQVSTRSEGPPAAVSRAQGMQNPITGPKTTIAAAPNTQSKRRRISTAAGTSTASGTAQSHRGPNRITVANHQRSPPNRSNSHTASTAATYNHVQTATAVAGQRRFGAGQRRRHRQDFRPDHEAAPPRRKPGRVVSGSIRGGRADNLAALRYNRAVDGRSPALLHSHNHYEGTPPVVNPDGVGCRGRGVRAVGRRRRGGVGQSYGRQGHVRPRPARRPTGPPRSGPGGSGPGARRRRGQRRHRGFR